jgi:hypothetical protein
MIREPFSLNSMKAILSKFKPEQLEISSHYLRYLGEDKRDISVGRISEFLFKRGFYFVEKQINTWVRYKIVYELSRRYDLVIVVKDEGKILKAVSCYKTNRKLKEKWKRISRSRMTK